MLSFHARPVLVQQEVLARTDYSDVGECGIDYYESDSQSEGERER